MRGKHLNSGIRGGLWEEQHLQGMGPAVWLFGWLIHRQTRERDGVGLVLAGSPLTCQIIGQDTGIAERTLKRWMARLRRGGYVQITHTAHKRMIVRIAKAKKFGPQQLGFPQKQLGFPQTPFFTPKSKGPFSAFDSPSKGPIVDQKGADGHEISIPKTESCVRPQAGHRETKPERKETADQTIINSSPSANGKLGDSASPVESKAPPRVPLTSLRSLSFPPSRVNPSRYGPDRRALREMELRAELRVGAGPVIQRE